MYKLKLCISILLVLFSGIPIVYAQTLPQVLGNSSSVAKYEVIMTRFRVYYDRRDDGGEIGWYTTFEGSGILDIASIDAGARAGNFISAFLPPGHISVSERTISGSFTLKAIVNYSGSTYYSTSNGSASTNASDYGESPIPIVGAGGVPVSSVTDQSSEDITLVVGRRIIYRLTFNLLSSNTDGTSGCVGLLPGNQVGRSEAFVIAPRQPNVSKDITYE